ncbi:HERV-H LTR-associating protein 1 [Conger conger]|uniref:HERV-H LTR-associating protein 1 n=1 Tax=Conger conger TaxID=82655 RepID=UPI002A5A8D17|nr:HERV-H LTR-associating protein 1 [Conger conger]
MADHGESRNLHWFCIKACAAIILLMAFYHTVLQNNSLGSMEKRELLISTEIPVEYIDPNSIDLTSLVNTLINSTQSGSQQLFSLLSVTSHSSLSLHKFTLLVYNISNFRNFETKLFPMRFCYCVSNKTNDLTDFTAILLDVIGNSTSYLQEIFKSSSILSVDQSNNSECIYICVMAGKTDRDLSPLWEMESIKPLFNQTITADAHKGCPRKRPGLRQVGGEEASVTNTTVTAQRLQPCLLELCKFFSQCLCRTYTKVAFVCYRYCVDTHPWYVQYTSEICRRVKRIAYSKKLKQKCLARMCTKL